MNILKSIMKRFNRYLKRLHDPKVPKKFESIDALIDSHFNVYSEPDHINRTGLTVALRQLGQKPALIVETGTSAWGTDSSRLFAAYVNSFGGEFHSVDIRPEARENMPFLGENVHFHVGDSIDFLLSFRVPKTFQKIDLLYLDSMDLNVLEPNESMEHGLKEFRASLRLLKRNSILVIDDTPIEPHLLGGEPLNTLGPMGLFQEKGPWSIKSWRCWELLKLFITITISF